MNTLEITPLENKKLNVLIIEKEYNEPFWLAENKTSSKNIEAIQKPSIGFFKFLESVLGKIKMDFASDELGMRSKADFNKSILSELFE